MKFIMILALMFQTGGLLKGITDTAMVRRFADPVISGGGVATQAPESATLPRTMNAKEITPQNLKRMEDGRYTLETLVFREETWRGYPLLRAGDEIDWRDTTYKVEHVAPRPQTGQNIYFCNKEGNP